MLGMAVFALATGPAWAADKSADEKTRPEDPTFAELDKDSNGYISKTEVAADPALARDFDKFDLNHDGKMSRSEYFAARGKEDSNPEATKMIGKRKAKEPAATSEKAKEPASTSGGSSRPGPGQ
jgi:hypothetical protein